MATLLQWINQFSDKRDAWTIYKTLSGVYAALSSVALNSATVNIKSTAKETIETGAVVNAVVNGSPVSLANDLELATPTGTVENGTHNVFVWTVDAAGNSYVQMGAPGAARADVRFPDIAPGRAAIAMVYINPTGTGDFVGGTTALDDATVTPNAALVNIVGPFNPSLQVQ